MSAASGDPAGMGMAHRNADAPAALACAATDWAAGGRAGTDSRAAVRRGPLVRTVRPVSASSIVTDPSSSVRSVRAPAARSRASVAGAGWPYVLPAPADATATRGRTASTNACVVAVRLP
jgi:hypothetical protein